METYEVTQALMSVGTVYNVPRPRTDETLCTVRGELVSTTPKLRLVEGTEGKAIADLTANFIKTKYDIRRNGQLLGALVFPAVAFKKTLTLTVGDSEYRADGVFKGVFRPPDHGSVANASHSRQLQPRPRAGGREWDLTIIRRGRA